MNRNEAKKLLPVITAFAEGKTIQIERNNGKWEDTGDEVSFVLNPSSYRIKPKPLERWLATPTAFGLSHNPDMKEQLCDLPIGSPSYWKFTLMREVPALEP